MQKNIFTSLLLLFLVAGLAVNSMANPPGDFDRPTKEQMERVRKRIETLRIWKLTKVLDLDEKSAARLFPLLNRYDKRRAEIERSLRDGMRDLREALREGREGRLQDILNELEQNHKALQGLKDEERAELRKILTIQQQAKFVIFLQEFNQEIRRIIEEAKKRRFKRFGDNGPGGPPPFPSGRP